MTRNKEGGKPMTVKVFKYGLLRPTKNADLVAEQLLLAHRYRNKLTEIERDRRAAERAAISSPVLVAAHEAVTAAADKRAEIAAQFKSLRQKKRSKKCDTSAARDALRLASEELRRCKEKLYELRGSRRSEASVKLARAAINERAKAKIRAARKECGVFWGTYLLAEAAVQAARKDTPLFDGVAPCDPRFAPWRGEGRLGVQIQRGACVAQIVGGADRRARIGAVDRERLTSPVRSERRRAARTVLMLRVGSNGRDPIWAEWPMTMHRPLPEGAVIKWVVVTKRMCGPRERWTVSVTVSLPAHPSSASAPCAAVGIDVGWRSFGDEGLRVAVTQGTDGERHELRMSAALLSSVAYPATLRSIRDRHRDVLRPLLFAWAQAQDELPSWFREATRYMPQWRSARRFAALARRWSENRWDTDDEGYAMLEAWRYKDHHLWQWESSQRSKSLGHRREQYRVFAAALARQYEVVVLEEFDLRVFARRPELGTPTEADDLPVARANRHTASVSEFREALTNAFLSRGGGVAYVSAVDSTRECHRCGHVEAFDAAAFVVHQCPKCKTIWDQDDNAAAVLLSRWRERPDDAKTLGSARNFQKAKENKDVTTPPPTKWQRIAQLKRATQDAARKPGANAPEIPSD